MPKISKKDMLRLTSQKLKNSEGVYKSICALIHYE